MDVLPEVNENATNPYSVQFWREWGSEEYSGHALFAVFCFTVPILILNILTAFAIKVSVAQWIRHSLHIPMVPGSSLGACTFLLVCFVRG